MITVRTHHLLAACLRQGPDAASAFNAWVQEVGSGEVHPSELRLMPLLQASLRGSGIDCPMLGRIGGMAKHVWLSGEVRLRQALTAVNRLQQGGISVTAIKGMALLARWPGAVHARPKGDFDVLVAPQRVREAVVMLARQGWHPMAHAPVLTNGDIQQFHALALLHPVHSRLATNLDLHWRPTVLVGDPAHAAGVLRRAEGACIGQHKLTVASLPDHLFILLAHALSELRLPRRDWVAEASMVLRMGGAGFDWDVYSRLVRRYGMQAWSQAALALVHGIAGDPVPAIATGAHPAPVQRMEVRVQSKPDPGSAIQSLNTTWCGASRSGRPLRHAVLASLAIDPWWGNRLPRLLQFKSVLNDADASGVQLVDGMLDLTRHSLDGSPLSGWGFPEPGGRWTVGPVAWLALAVPANVPARVPLRLRVHPHLPAESTGLRLHVWAGAAPEVWTLEDRDQQLTLDAQPIHWRHGKVVPVQLRIERAHPLSRSHPDDDQRDLGVLLRRLDLALVDTLPSLETPLHLDGPGASQAAWSGWGDPEPLGRWTVGADARLLLRRPSVPAPGLLHLEVPMVFGPGGHTTQTVDVSVDGQHAATATLSDRGVPYAIEVPVSPGGERLLDLRLRIKRPTSPASTGQGADGRLLGVMVRRVSWTTVR